MRVKASKKPEATIPVAAMSDIAFLLIVFFMLTAEMSQTGMEYNPPRQEKEEKKEEAVFAKELEIRKDDTLRLNGQQQTLDELRTNLERAFERAKDETGKVCTLRMHPESHYETFFEVVDLVKELGGYVTPKSEADDQGAGESISMDSTGSGGSRLEEMKNEATNGK